MGSEKQQESRKRSHAIVSGSPDRSRRKGKPATERPESEMADTSPTFTGDERHQRRRLQDPLPLEPHADSANASRKRNRRFVEDKNPNEINAIEHARADPTYVPRSGSYVQHDDRTGSSLGRSNKRRTYDGDYRGQPRNDDRFKDSNSGPPTTKRRDDKQQGSSANTTSGSVWKHDKFFEAQAEEGDQTEPKTEPQQVRKRSFMEKRAPDATIVAEGHPKRIDSKDRFPLERSEKNDELQKGGSDFKEDSRREDHFRKRYEGTESGRWMDNERFDRFQSRQGFNRSRGRDRFGRGFVGNEQRFRADPVVDKWKHDLFDQVNRSPSPKNEDDNIAKIEALLAT